MALLHDGYCWVVFLFRGRHCRHGYVVVLFLFVVLSHYPHGWIIIQCSTIPKQTKPHSMKQIHLVYFLCLFLENTHTSARKHAHTHVYTHKLNPLTYSPCHPQRKQNPTHSTCVKHVVYQFPCFGSVPSSDHETLASLLNCVKHMVYLFRFRP